MASHDKDQRAARRRAAREKAAREEASGRRQVTRAKAAPAESGGGTAAALKTAAGPAAPEAPRKGGAVPVSEVDHRPLSPALRVSWYALLVAVFLVPIAIGNLTFLSENLVLTRDGFDIVKVFVLRVCTLVALAAWGWHMLREGGELRRTPVDWLILAFLAWVTVATVTSINWPVAVFGKARRYDGLLSFINYAVLYFLVLQFTARAGRVRTLAQALFLSSVIVSVHGLLQFLGLDPVRWGTLPFEANRAFATFGNPDLLGGFLIFSVTVALGLALAEPRVWWRMGYWAGFGLNGLTLIVAFTRGAWIGSAVGVLLVCVVAWRHRARLQLVDGIPIAIGGVLGAFVIWRSLSSGSEVLNFAKRLASIFDFKTGSGQTRTEIWQAALAAIEDRPILGWGPDTFRLIFPRYKPVEYVRDAGGYSVADNAHSYPLQLAAGIGVVGMAMFYGIFVWAGVRSFRTVFGRSQERQRVLRGAFWAAAAGFLVQLFFGLSVTGSAFLLWTSLAVVLAPTAKVVDLRAPRWGMIAGVVVLVLAALGVGYQVLPIMADHASLLSRNTSGPDRVAVARRAASYNPFDPALRAELGLAASALMGSYIQAAQEAQAAGQDPSQYVAAIRTSFADAIKALQEAIDFQPDEYDNYVGLAEVYNMAGRVLDPKYFDDSIAAAQKALELSPYGTAIRLRLADAYLGKGETDKAIETLAYVVKIDPRGADAAKALATIYVRQGQLKPALEVLKQLDVNAPGQEGVADAIRQLEASISAGE